MKNQLPKNPFFTKGEIPDDFFCDRVEETRRLIKHSTNGRDVVLSASRRVGKTGLIMHCFHQPELADEYYTFFVDILDTTSLREFTYALGREIFEKLKPKSKKMAELFLRTVASISSEFKYDYLSGMPKFNFSIGALRNPDTTLAEIFDYIDKADKRCLIAIDEFQQICHYPEKNIEALLRTYIQHCNNADFIFAGSERHILAEMFNLPSRPFYASTAQMSLEPIDLDVYEDFVSHNFDRYGKQVDRKVVRMVYELFDGNTYCLQKVFNVAFSMTAQGAICDDSVVNDALDDILQEEERNYQNRLSQLTPKPKELLFAIASEKESSRMTSGDYVRRHHLSSPSSVQSATKQLLENDWITYRFDEKGNKIFSLSDQFLSLWIRRRFTN